MCVKNKKACLQKLKESSNNPLLLFKQQRSSSSDSSSSGHGSSDCTSDNSMRNGGDSEVETSHPRGLSSSPSVSGKKDMIAVLTKNASSIYSHLKSINKFNE